MAGITDLLFGSKPLPTVTSQDTTNTTYPVWYQTWLNQLLGKAGSVANEPYQPYGQPRIAPFSSDTGQAFGQVRAGQGAWQPEYGQGISAITSAGGQFDPNEFSQYMNPYIDSVVNRIGELGGRNLSENLLPQVNDSFIRAGQFGSSGNFDLTGRALRDTQEAVLAQQNQALAGGFDSSMKNYQGALDRRLSAGQALGSAAQLGQGLRLQDAAALQGIGGAQEDKTQQSLNLGYQDFLEQRDYPRSQVDWLSNIIRGVPAPTSTTSTSTGTANQSQLAPNTLAQLAGTALGIYGLSGGFKRGGRVRAKKKMPQMRKAPAPVIDMEPAGESGGISQFRMAA